MNRPTVSRALASLQRLHTENSGTIGRIVSCLEDFYARYDLATASTDPGVAALTMPILLDTRAEALNLLNAVTSFASQTVEQPLTKNVRVVTRAVRRDTQQCITALGRAHAHVPGLHVARAWQPPYAFDARHDPGTSIAATFSLSC